MNSDDVLTPGAIRKVVDFFLNHPHCDMVYGQADYIDEHDNIIGTYKTDEYSFNRLSQDCMICQPAAFWRRRVVEKIGFLMNNSILLWIMTTGYVSRKPEWISSFCTKNFPVHVYIRKRRPFQGVSKSIKKYLAYANITLVIHISIITRDTGTI